MCIFSDARLTLRAFWWSSQLSVESHTCRGTTLVSWPTTGSTHFQICHPLPSDTKRPNGIYHGERMHHTCHPVWSGDGAPWSWARATPNNYECTRKAHNSRARCRNLLLRPIRRWSQRLWSAWWLRSKVMKGNKDVVGTVAERNSHATDYKPQPPLKCVAKLLYAMKWEIERALPDIGVVTKTDVESIFENFLTKWANMLQWQIFKTIESTFEDASQMSFFN